MMNCRAIFIILAILMLSGQLTDGRAIGAVKFDLRCHCIRSALGIPRKYIKKLEIIPAGPHCTKVQIIATLRKGRKVCVNPKADLIKKIGRPLQWYIFILYKILILCIIFVARGFLFMKCSKT